MANIEITGKGIQKVLSKFDFKQAIAEYIWNGFDAKATTVQFNYEANELGFVSRIAIIDNGYGINRTQLADKFSPFFDSQKAIEIESPKNTSAVHGKNGVGRLTFFKFASEAIWHTVYEEKESTTSILSISSLNPSINIRAPIQVYGV
ncbi:ATP-binding protein [Paraflavitalea speifideaquila]|uniref:ATP-binding protein n=1 Tax=Paraflavitalea speifideaquila TaxID=3076558 RepID=UPI0028ECA7C6|nr:ATP-binding protein [Paraflavitalea speifideiaquila]